MMKTKFAFTVFLILISTVCYADQQIQSLPPGTGGLSGSVRLDIKEGKPIPGVLVSIFALNNGLRPDDSALQRVPEGLIRVGKSGIFKAALPAGRYYLGVLFRDENFKGPPMPDEKYFFPRDKDNKLIIYDIVAGKILEVGELSGVEPETATASISNPLTVEGTIFNEQGKPFAGALIMIRSKLDEPRPLYISSRTGDDGKYQLKLPAGGPYFLVARTKLVNVGRPRPGDFVGTYGGTPPQAGGKAPSVFSGGDEVSGAANEVLKGINIVMYKVPDPEEVKNKLLDESEKPIFPGRGGQNGLNNMPDK